MQPLDSTQNRFRITSESCQNRPRVVSESSHTYARVPADLAQAPDGGGKVGGWSGEVFYGVLHKETWPKHSPNRPKPEPKIGPNLWKAIPIRLGRSLVMIALQQPYCIRGGSGSRPWAVLCRGAGVCACSQASEPQSPRRLALHRPRAAGARLAGLRVCTGRDPRIPAEYL